MRLRCEAFAKVNRSLVVLGRRADGYHELHTVFQAIDFSDVLAFEPSQRLELLCDDPSIPAGEDNLVVQAVRALEREAGRPLPARIALTKRIPAGGGLAGGSSDAVAALRGVARLHGLALPHERLHALAASLGSDLNFFLVGGRARGTGRGERVAPLPDVEGPGETLLLLLPPFALATPDVFRALGAPALTETPAASNIRGSGPEVSPDRNDLEPAAESLRSELRDLRLRLRAAGARSARLSGSGSTVFGAFGSESEAEAAVAKLGPLPDGTRTYVARTLGRAEFARRSEPRRRDDPGE